MEAKDNGRGRARAGRETGVRRPRRITGAQHAAAGLVAVLFCGRASVAEAVQVGNLAELQEAIRAACDGSGDPDIELMGDLATGGWLDATNETPAGGIRVEAGSFTLPPMDFGKGEYTIVGGKLTADTMAAKPSDDRREKPASSLIRISSEASVTFEGTTIDLTAVFGPDAPQEEKAHTVFDLYPGSLDDGGEEVVLTGLIMSENEALHIPLTLTTHPGPYSGEPATRKLRITSSQIVVGNGGALHATLRGAESVQTSVTVEDTRIVGTDGDGLMPKVGSEYGPGPDDTEKLGFLHTTGAVQLVNSRVSNLVLQSQPLVEAPTVLLDRMMIDGVHQDPPEAEAVIIADGEHVQVVSSLMCDLTGGEAILGAHQGVSAAPVTALVMHSALWGLGNSLFTMDPPSREDCTGASDKAGLVAANVTLHRDPSSVPMNASIPLISSSGEVCGRVLNTYIEGAWSLEGHFPDGDEEPRMVAESLIMSDSGSGDAADASLCGEVTGCRDDVPSLLPDALKEASCRDVMDQLEGHLLDGATRGDLAELEVGALESRALRPALGQLAELPPAATWSYPDRPGESDDHGGWAEPDGSDVEPVNCVSHMADEEVALGAWASAENECSLPVLEVWGSLAVLDVWEVKVDEASEESEPSAYGLADGCRYGSAWLFAPLLWGRTRRRSSRSGDRP